MTKEKFEEIKKRFKKIKTKELSIRVGHIWGFISANRDWNREEILELMEILFD